MCVRPWTGAIVQDILGFIHPTTPIHFPAASTYAETDFADGFTIQYVYDDWYVADMSTSGASITLGSCTVDDLGDNTGTGTTPDEAPANAFFVDVDLNRLSIQGNVYATASTSTQFKVILEKVQAPGTWGFLLDDNAILFGPRDTWGHQNSALPYYASGGSTGTDAPSNLIDQGEGDSAGGDEPNPNPNATPGTGDDPPESAGGPLSHQGTGGLVNTAGGGPAGARVFNKHGDVLPGSARGMHPDYWEEEVVEVATYGPAATPAVTTTTLQRSQGSPPSPLYRFKVVACDANGNCADKKRYAYTIQVVDIAMYEPKATFFGDLDPKTRVLAGEITIVPPAYANGLQGYRLYPTADGNTNLALEWSDTTADGASGVASQNAQYALNLHKSCPPDARNDDWTQTDANWQALAREPCGNDNPYSPKCRGKTCPHINILPGSQGEFYISRFDNNGNAENPDGASVDDGANTAGSGDKTSNLPQEYTSNTARRNYGDNEFAQIYLPKSGWLTPILMDVATGDAGDTLLLKRSADDGSPEDLKTATLSNYIDITEEESVIEWTTDSHNTAHG